LIFVSIFVMILVHRCGWQALTGLGQGLIEKLRIIKDIPGHAGYWRFISENDPANKE